MRIEERHGLLVAATLVPIGLATAAHRRSHGRHRHTSATRLTESGSVVDVAVLLHRQLATVVVDAVFLDHLVDDLGRTFQLDEIRLPAPAFIAASNAHGVHRAHAPRRFGHRPADGRDRHGRHEHARVDRRLGQGNLVEGRTAEQDCPVHHINRLRIKARCFKQRNPNRHGIVLELQGVVAGFDQRNRDRRLLRIEIRQHQRHCFRLLNRERGRELERYGHIART